MNVADGITSGKFLYKQYLDVSSPQVVSREPKHASPSNLRAHGARFPFRAVLHPKLDFSSTPYTDIRAEFPLPGSSPLFRENSSLHLALVHMVAVVERETGRRSRRRSVRVVSGGEIPRHLFCERSSGAKWASFPCNHQKAKAVGWKAVFSLLGGTSSSRNNDPARFGASNYDTHRS